MASKQIITQQHDKSHPNIVEVGGGALTWAQGPHDRLPGAKCFGGSNVLPPRIHLTSLS